MMIRDVSAIEQKVCYSRFPRNERFSTPHRGSTRFAQEAER